MPVSKRTRFEVLRRDGFRCYYCGTRGPETGQGLQIDHVVPVALGGSDQPTNLVSACRDCNYGKASTPADAELVAAVEVETEKARAAQALARAALVADLDREEQYVNHVWDLWDEAFDSKWRDNRDVDSLAHAWCKRGVPMQVVREALRIAAGSSVPHASRMRYAGGVVNNMMQGIETRALAIVSGEDEVYTAGYDSGFHDGQIFADSHARDIVAEHIDRGLLSHA